MLHMVVAGSDDTVRAWDTRSCQQVSCLNGGPSQEVFSFSFGGSGDDLFAAGCKSQILFWDWRNKKQVVVCLEESHKDDVTQVHFVPCQQNKLLSASIDGLICWLSDNSSDVKHSWISSSLAEKLPKNRKKNRHQPY